jgi:hypothetical protein
MSRSTHHPDSGKDQDLSSDIAELEMKMRDIRFHFVRKRKELGILAYQIFAIPFFSFFIHREDMLVYCHW